MARFASRSPVKQHSRCLRPLRVDKLNLIRGGVSLNTPLGQDDAPTQLSRSFDDCEISEAAECLASDNERPNLNAEGDDVGKRKFSGDDNDAQDFKNEGGHDFDVGFEAKAENLTRAADVKSPNMRQRDEQVGQHYHHQWYGHEYERDNNVAGGLQQAAGHREDEGREDRHKGRKEKDKGGEGEGSSEVCSSSQHVAPLRCHMLACCRSRRNAKHQLERMQQKALSAHGKGHDDKNVDENNNHSDIGDKTGSRSSAGTNKNDQPNSRSSPASSAAAKKSEDDISAVMRQLSFAYLTKVRPLEVMFRFQEFCDPTVPLPSFRTQPVVLLIGPYSVGKTSAVHRLLNLTRTKWSPIRNDLNHRNADTLTCRCQSPNHNSSNLSISSSSVSSSPSSGSSSSSSQSFSASLHAHAEGIGRLSRSTYHPSPPKCQHQDQRCCHENQGSGSGSVSTHASYNDIGYHGEASTPDVGSNPTTSKIRRFKVVSSTVMAKQGTFQGRDEEFAGASDRLGIGLIEEFGAAFAGQYFETIEIAAGDSVETQSKDPNESSAPCGATASPPLDPMTFIDTPGICKRLGGEFSVITPSTISGSSSSRLNLNKETEGQDFAQVCAWLGARCDLILFMLDGNRLELSGTTTTEVLTSLRPLKDRLRVILNKADLLTPRELLHASARLHWGLQYILGGLEPPRYYATSLGKMTLDEVFALTRARSDPTRHPQGSNGHHPENCVAKGATTTATTNTASSSSRSSGSSSSGNSRSDGKGPSATSHPIGPEVQTRLVNSEIAHRKSHEHYHQCPGSHHCGHHWHCDNSALIAEEQRQLIHDLRQLNRQSMMKRVASLVRRAQKLMAHLVILKHLSDHRPIFYRQRHRTRQLRDLPSLFRKASEDSGHAIRELPDPTHWLRGAQSAKFDEMPRVRRRHIDELSSFLSETLPPLLRTLTFTADRS
eukprot:CAMPEP_0184482766 /NCGR_PEP_ID=MMETSP0113_2-20130426/4342_1 /TAXON_ID=91329 /ORGANISM="Norrisiella sphaerica, Strain BC52" /LENGTH=941 /DNA_ID=CAMNT_0026862707 /DNA_START=362 /DNA_END=3187 /DNA_ORIENTATION=-